MTSRQPIPEWVRPTFAVTKRYLESGGPIRRGHRLASFGVSAVHHSSYISHHFRLRFKGLPIVSAPSVQRSAAVYGSATVHGLHFLNTLTPMTNVAWILAIAQGFL